MRMCRGTMSLPLISLSCWLVVGCASLPRSEERVGSKVGVPAIQVAVAPSPGRGPVSRRSVSADPAVRLVESEAPRPVSWGVEATPDSGSVRAPLASSNAANDDDDDDDGPSAAPGSPPASHPEKEPVRVAIRRPGAGLVGERPDFDLDRPRAERAGEGGAPTKEDEKKDEREEAKEDFPNPYLLMHALGVAESRLKFYGWVEGSFTANPKVPAGAENFGLFPNSQANVWLFPQIYFVFERRPQEGDQIDYGFRFDNFFGNGSLGNQNAGIIRGPLLPGQFGWDPVQFYGELHLPVLTEGGIDLKVGRYYSLAGYEDGIAPGRPLLTTSYMFSYGQPFAQVGILSTWHVTDRFNWYNGLSLYNTSVDGYNRLFSMNGSIGYTGGFSWDSQDDRTNLTVTLDVGSNIFPAYPVPGVSGRRPPAPVHRPGPDEGPDFLTNRFATLFTEMLTHEWTEKLSTIIEADEAMETDVPGVGPSRQPGNASWFGLGGWVLYDITDRWTGVCRLESFWDVNGARTGYPTTFYEATLGAIYKPRPWLWFRPEVRGDWSDRFHPFNEGKSSSQLTFGFDAIVLF